MLNTQSDSSNLKQTEMSSASLQTEINTNNINNKRKTPLKLIVGGIVLLLMMVGSGAALYLTQISQDVRQQANIEPYCGDGVCQNPGNPCSCLADCGNEPGADQCSSNSGNNQGSDSVNVGETYTPNSSPVSCQGGSLCNCAPNDLCKPLNGSGTSNSGPNGQTCFLGTSAFQCVKRAVVETIATGGEGASCEIGQRTACGSDGCEAGQQRLCGGGANGLGACTWTDRCIGDSDRGNGEITDGQNCDGLKRVSGGEPSKGGFVGCSGIKNCFCQGSINTGSAYSSGNVVCYDDYQNDSCGAPGVGGPTSTQPPITEPPTTEPPVTEPPITSSPSPSPTSYFCNSNCSNDQQCQSAGNNLFCSNGKCRLNTNPTNADCQPAIGPMCLDIDLVDGQTGIVLAADPSFGDSIKFTCANVTGADHYIFRVIEPDQNIINLQATGLTSESYTINKSGKFYAQCQICTGEDNSSCHAYEALN